MYGKKRTGMYGMYRRNVGLVVAGLAAAVWVSSAQAVPSAANLFVQLEGDQLTGEVAGLFTWEDQAALGGTNSASTSTVGKLPVVTAGASPNGLFPVVTFDGSDFLDIASNAVFENTSFTWLMVVRTDAPGSTQWLYGNAYTSLDGGATNPDSVATNHAWGTFTDSAGYRQNVRSATGALKAPFPTGHVITSDWFIIQGFWNGDLVNTQIINATNTLETSKSTSGANSVPTNHKRSRLGASPQSGGTGFAGQVAALLVYDTGLNGAEQAAAQQYLYDKYFVPEPGALCLMALGGLAFIRRRP